MKNIKKYRGAKNLTQQQLADILGVSRVTVNNMETIPGYATSDDNVKKLCELFKCKPYDICDTDTILRYKPSSREDAEALVKEIKEKYYA